MTRSRIQKQPSEVRAYRWRSDGDATQGSVPLFVPHSPGNTRLGIDRVVGNPTRRRRTSRATLHQPTASKNAKTHPNPRHARAQHRAKMTALHRPPSGVAKLLQTARARLTSLPPLPLARLRPPRASPPPRPSRSRHRPLRALMQALPPKYSAQLAAAPSPLLRPTAVCPTAAASVRGKTQYATRMRHPCTARRAATSCRQAPTRLVVGKRRCHIKRRRKSSSRS